MHFMYGDENGNSREARRLYSKTGCPIQKHFCTCIGSCLKWDPLTLPGQMQILQRQLEQQLGRRRAYFIWWKIRWAQTRGLCPCATFHNMVDAEMWKVAHINVQRVQALTAGVYPHHVDFFHFGLQQSAVHPDFLLTVLSTNECTFTYNSVFNPYN